MSVELNHTIIPAHDKVETAAFLATMLGLPEPRSFGPFLSVQTENGVTLDVLDTPGPVTTQHYAFLVSEEEFDAVLERIRQRRLTYWADPLHHQLDQVNHADGGRGLYWEDPNGHNLEIITRPYGSGE